MSAPVKDLRAVGCAEKQSKFDLGLRVSCRIVALKSRVQRSRDLVASRPSPGFDLSHDQRSPGVFGRVELLKRLYTQAFQLLPGLLPLRFKLLLLRRKLSPMGFDAGIGRLLL